MSNLTAMLERETKKKIPADSNRSLSQVRQQYRDRLHNVNARDEEE
jgi:hypothetical protein